MRQANTPEFLKRLSDVKDKMRNGMSASQENVTTPMRWHGETRDRGIIHGNQFPDPLDIPVFPDPSILAEGVAQTPHSSGTGESTRGHIDADGRDEAPNEEEPELSTPEVYDDVYDPSFKDFYRDNYTDPDKDDPTGSDEVADGKTSQSQEQISENEGIQTTPLGLCASCKAKNDKIADAPRHVTAPWNRDQDYYTRGDIINFSYYKMSVDRSKDNLKSKLGDVCAKRQYGLVVEKCPTHMVVLVFIHRRMR
jgi:hypothetical protein